jgi:hypothetical protein
MSADVAEAIWYVQDGSSPITVLKPAAFADGQMLMAIVCMDGGVISALTADPGWTEETNNINISGQDGKVFWRVYAGGEPSSWAFAHDPTGGAALVLLRITQVYLTPTVVTVPAPTTSGSNGSTMDSPTVTPPGTNDLLIATFSMFGGGLLSLTQPSGMTSRSQIQAPGNFQALAAASEQLFVPGATGVRTWTSISPTGKQSGAFSVAVKSLDQRDPDPPRNPPVAILPPWMLDELVEMQQRRLVGNQGAPWVQQVLSGGASGANVTLTTAQGTEVGMVLVCFFGNNFGTAANMPALTGTAGTWTLEATGDNGTDSAHLKVFTRPVTVAGPQTVTVAPNVGEEVWQHLYVIGGADLTDPSDDAAGGNGASSVSQVAPSVTPTTAAPLLLCAAQSAVGTATYTAPPGMVERTDLNTPGFGAGTTAAQVLGGAGATGTRMFTASVAQPYATVSIAVRPVAPPPTTIDATATPATVAGTATIPTPVAVTGSTATPAVVVAATTIPTPAVGAPAVPAVVAGVTSIPAPTVTTGSTATPAVLAAAASIPAPTVVLSVLAAPAVVAATATVPAPVVTTGTAASPAKVSAVASIPAPTPVTGSTATPGVVAATSTVPAPTLATSSTATPAVVAGAASIPVPTAAGGAGATPAVVPAVAAIPTPTVSTGATALPVQVAGVTSIPTPIVVTSSTAAPAVVVGTATIPTPSVSAGGSAATSPAVVAATSSIPTPGISAGQVATPAVTAAAAAIPAPTAHAGATAVAAVVACTATIPGSTVTAGTKASPAAVAGAASIPSPTIFTLVTATPAAVALVATIPAPTVRSSSVAVVPAVLGVASIPVPPAVGPPPEPWTAQVFESGAAALDGREPGVTASAGREPGGGASAGLDLSGTGISGLGW